MKKIIALAPMDGITNCAYRTITKELFEKHNTDISSELWLRTEFMNVEGFIREPGRLIHHIIKTDYEDKTIAQIYWWDHSNLVETAQYLDKYHREFAGIELNIWCPSPKIMACGWGAGMMRDRPRTTAIIKEIAATCSLPFSIKTRVGLTVDDKEAQKNFILDIAQYCHHIIIHGRTYKQSHSWDVDWDFIRDIKCDLGDSCIVIWNGWIQTYDQIHERMSGLDWTMIWQAAIGRPWLFTNHTPTLTERFDVIQRHAKMAIILYDWYTKQSSTWRDFQQPTYERLQEQIYNFDAATYSHEQTMVEYRKYLFNYISGLPGNRELKQEIAQIKDYNITIDRIKSFFDKIQP